MHHGDQDTDTYKEKEDLQVQIAHLDQLNEQDQKKKKKKKALSSHLSFQSNHDFELMMNIDLQFKNNPEYGKFAFIPLKSPLNICDLKNNKL